MLAWEFVSEGQDVGFSVRRAADPAPSSVEKFNAQERMIFGRIASCEAGEYIIRFDNSYSWVRGKKVHYRLFLDSEELPRPDN